MKIITYCTKFFLLFTFAKALVRLPFILSKVLNNGELVEKEGWEGGVGMRCV